MKQLLRFKTFLIMALMAMIGTNVWADEVNLSGGSHDGSAITWTVKDGTTTAVTIMQQMGSGSTAVNSSYISAPRLYKGHILSFEAASGYAITSISITYNSTYYGNSMTAGTVVDGTTVTNNTTEVARTWATTSGGTHQVSSVSTNGLSAIYIQNVATTNVQLRPTKIEVTYITAGNSNLTASDLALTGAPVALSFDLYNNATPQVVNYTTSSTGAVTIADNDYATFVVDETNKTITVTPTAVTPSTQTITVSQAADDKYAAGSVTFTLDVADSTPTVGGWVETALADLTADDVFVIVGANSTSTYAMSNGNGTTSAPSAVKVTVTDDEITSKVTDDIKWTISGDATNGYTFYPAGSTDTWLYCTNTNNGVRVGDNTNNAFTVTDGYLKHSGTNRYLGVYSSQDWRCYTSINNNISGQTFKFYRYDDGSTPSKANPELAFSSTTAEASVGQPFKAPTLSTAAGFYGTVEYTSSDQTVARVMDTEAGTLEIVGGGTTTITATFAGNDDFKAGSASYTLTVTDNRIATTITQENIVLDVADVATLTKLAPVVKDADNNTVAYQYSEFPPEVSFEVVSDENAIIGSIDNNNGDITLNAVNGTATLKAYYNLYGVNSTYQPSECTFTITVESALENLAAFKALDDNETATVRLNNVKVLAVSGSQYIWLRDASGALLVYNSGLSYTAGQVLNGKMTAKKTTYRNQVETTGTIDGSNIVATDGDAAIPVEVDEADAVNYDSDLVKLSGVTVSGGVIAGENALTIYDGRFNLEYSFDETKTYNITGIIGKYNSNNQIYPISVEEVEGPAVPTIGLSTTTVNAEAAGANGTIDVTYANFTAANAGIELFEADGTTSATYDWLTASFDDDATIVYTIQENTTTEARTAYFKAYAMNGETKVYSDLVTVAQAGVVVDYATLPFSFDGGKADVEGTIGLTHEGLGSDYSSAPKLKFDTTGDVLVLKFNERPGTLTFDIKGNSFSGGTFTVQTSEDGVTYTDLETYDALADMQSEELNNLGEDVRYIKWVYTKKSSGNVALGNIALVKYTDTPVVVVAAPTFNPAGGEVAAGTEVTLSAPEASMIVYTTDGTDPSYVNSNGEVYTTPIVVNADMTIKAIAVDDNDNESEVVSATYTVAAEEVEGVKYYKVTSTDQLEEGVDYLLVYEGVAGEGAAAYGGLNDYTKDSYGKSEALKHIAGGVVTITDEAVVPVTLKSRSEDGTKWAMRDATGWIAAVNGNNLHGNKPEDDAVWTFDFTAEAHKQIYHEFSGNTDTRYLEYNTNNPRFAGYTGTQSAVYLYKAASYNVSVGATGYATLYYGTKNLVVPENVEAYTYTVSNGKLEESYMYSPNEVIPAGTGVILKASTGEYKFTVTEESGLEDSDNLLFGFDEASTTVAPAAGDYLFYLLGVDNGKVGFYWGKDNGAAFTSGAHKAYLAVPTEQASGLRGFSFDGSVVGINTIGVDMPEGNAYDLQGRRVQQLQKNGLYIVDGKKVLAK